MCLIFLHFSAVAHVLKMNSILQGKLLPVSRFSGGRVSVAPGASRPAAGPAPCPPPPGRAPASAARPATPASQQPALQRKQLLSGFPEPARYTVPRAHQGGTSARPVSRVFDVRSWRTPGTVGCPAVSAKPSLYEPHGSQSVPLIWQLVK